MKKIAVISSSTRTGKKSHRVALAIMDALRKLNDIEPFMIDAYEPHLPQFIERLDKMENPPQTLLDIEEKLRSAQGVVFVSPEYNGSYCSGLKTLVDIMPRPVFAGKPIAVSSVSNGPLKGMRGALQMQLLVLAIQAFPQPRMLLVGEVHKQLDEEAKPLNDDILQQTRQFAEAFAEHVNRF